MIVDAIVTWVDGSDPVHAAKLSDWLARTAPGQKLISKAAIPHRFAHHSEIVYCLRSIRRHAPWIRTIWLLTDNQFPAEFDRAAAAAHGIRVVDHRHIFRGLEELLPTFNSIAIETLMWRIQGLAERFIYFNDDMFLVHPNSPENFFEGGKLVLRGRIVDWSMGAPKPHHPRAQYNAARLIGHDLTRMFTPAHVPYPMRKSIMAELYERFFPSFVTNAALRFRTNGRVHPVTLMNLSMFARDRVALRSGKRTTYLGTDFCETATPEALSDRLGVAMEPHKLSVCINGFGAAAAKLPDLAARMEAMVGPVQPWEKASRLDRAG